MSDDVRYDLIVIGAGPGGYVAAIRASQLGMKVAVVEKRATLGGVCLNEGCIPSKALLDSSELFVVARDRFLQHGIVIDPPRLDLDAMMLRKDDVVRKLTDGIAYLFKKNEIERIQGTATLKGRDATGQHRVEVTPAVPAPLPEGQQTLLAPPQRRIPSRPPGLFLLPAVKRSDCPAYRLTARWLSAPGRRSPLVLCLSISSLPAAVISGWSWVQSGAVWVPG